MLKKRRRKRKREKKRKNQSHKNYKENIGTKLITNTKKQKLKNLEQSLEFQKYNVKKKKKKNKKNKETKQTNKQKQTMSQKL